MIFMKKYYWNGFPIRHLSQAGEALLLETSSGIDRTGIYKRALDTDLKDICAPILSNLNKVTVSKVILQIQKIRNISAPKANENSQAAPRMLKIILTDGDSYIQAIEVSPLSFLSNEKTPPGSKLLIQSAKIRSGYLLLDAQSCTLLGGTVPALYEKWELSKSVKFQQKQRNTSIDGAPVWVNFGKKIPTDFLQDLPIKSLQDPQKNEIKENSKFDLQRQDAIAEAATSGAIKKVFGGASKQQQSVGATIRNKKTEFKDRKNQKLKIGKDIDDKLQKPSDKVSLFSFLEDKLPSNDISNKPVTANSRYSSNNNFDRTSYEQKTQINNKIKVNDTQEFSNSFAKVSLENSHQFASRSLKQHLNLGPQKQNLDSEKGEKKWNIGDSCIAKYWEDGKFYNATITAVTDKTCVVKFKGYGNVEEVVKVDCLPVTKNENTERRPYSRPMDFRRSYKKQ